MNTQEIVETLTLINSLEQEVKKLHSIGEELVLNDCRVKIMVENFDKKAEAEAKSAINGTSDIHEMFMMSFSRASRATTANPDEVENVVEINDSLGIEIVSMLIQYKTEHIAFLQKKLKGVKF